MFYPSSENKGADLLRGYREADLRLCFRLCRLLVFPRGGSVMSSLNLHEWALLTSSVSCYMRTQKPGESRNFVPISAEDLNNVRSDPVLMQNSYMFTKHIRGTAAYWKSALVRLLAMVSNFFCNSFVQ